MSEPESSGSGANPEAPAEPVTASIGGRVFAWLQRAPAFIEDARTVIQRRRRMLLLTGLVLVAAVFVFLRVSVKGHAWVVPMAATLVSARSWILGPQPLPEVLVVAGILVVLALWLLPRWQAARSRGLTDQNHFDRENEARKTLAQIIGGVLVLGGLYSSLQTFSLQQHTLSLQQHTFDLQRESQITDRFTKAIDQLGAVEPGGKSDADGKPKINLEARLGGIYALERIAHDSPMDHWTIIEVLSTYVRENSRATSYVGKTAPRHPSLRTTTPPAEAGERHLRADIQAILTVIGRRDRTHDPPYRKVDLSHADLGGADLGNAHLEGAYLDETDLSGADLTDAHLEAADLEGANLKAYLEGADLEAAYLEATDLSAADLKDAHLSGADLTNAHLKAAHLEGTYLVGADLSGVDLSGADLTNAHLEAAHLEAADLSGAFGVSQSQLDKARGDINTKLPEGNGLTRPASWHSPTRTNP